VSARTAAAGALLLAAAAGWAAAAGPSSRVAWTLETLSRVRRGVPARGKTIHDRDCEACHGPVGNIDTPDVPNLAGQNVLYTYKQLADYKAGLRTSPIMNEAVAALSDADFVDLAAFYAAQAPQRDRPGTKPAPAAAAKLVSVGDGERLIPACDACHGERGAGNPRFYGMPSLHNQKFDDLVTELTTFKTGERANDVYSVMRQVAKRLTEAEIAALAEYYAGARKTEEGKR
jgi:cytochrome c553